MLKLCFSKRYGLTTLLVIIACGVMFRLGFWQLDRLAQRQIRNAEIAQSLATPPLVLTGNTRPENLELRQFQTIVVRGVFDHSQEVALQNQTWQGEPGVHLITPLVIGGGQQAILVDRGWIPYSVAEPEHWANFQTTGPVEISGMIRMSQPRPNAPPLKEPELNIFRVDIDRLQGQISHRLLPVFIAQSPVLAQGQLPYRSQPEIQLTNGPHLGYAIQWFSFSVILAVGYVVFVRQHAQPAPENEPETLSIPMEA